MSVWSSSSPPRPPEVPAVYSFLPWLRRGMSLAITRKDELGTGNNPQRVEAEISMRVDVGASRGNTRDEQVNTKVALYGPGDITSLHPSIIIRREPVPNSVDFEPNFLAFIEFAQPDFPWLYTPAAANDRKTIRPWIFLIVLSDDGTEYDKVNVDPNKPLPWITVTDTSKLPNPAQIWAWAHVQVLSKIQGEISDELKKRPSEFISRIICPRKLKPNQSYAAFLVPSFETGRLAGLGEDVTGIDGLKSAWPSNNVPIKLPFYDSFKFKTGIEGDFESLVRKLEHRQMLEGVGVRDMDVSSAGYNLPSASASGILGLEGALKAISTTSNTWNDEYATQFKEKLKEILNAPDEAIVNGQDGLPKVAPPIYGCWHGQASRVDPTNFQRWINDLNLDPRNRAAAGLGTLVVRKEQDKLMASAWRQLADIQRINQTIKQTQLAIQVSSKHMERIKALSAEDAITLVFPVHGKVLMMGASKTIIQNFKESPIPEATLLPAFKQIIRPRGPLRKRQRMIAQIIEGKEEPTLPQNNGNNILSRINRREITAAPPRTKSDKMAEIDTVSDTLAMASDNITHTHALASKREEDEIRFEKLAERLERPLTEPRYTPEETEFIWAARELTTVIRAVKIQEQERTNLESSVKSVEINQIHSVISGALNPSVDIAASLRNRLRVMRSTNWDPQDPIEPIMAAPAFPQPMYEALRDISQDYLLPGLEKIPPNTIGLLTSNQRFIEAYMVGLNHEMSRELLWREYPTDRRGSYFRQFWDIRGSMPANTVVPEEIKEIEEIHKWKRDSKLGEHSPRKISDPNKGYIVLLIRGDLLKRYPNSAIYAVRAVKDETPDRIFNRKPEDSQDNRKDPIFRGLLYPDVTFFGFDLTIEEARGGSQSSPEGWYFVIKEQPSEPRFGLDAEDVSKPFRQQIDNWDELSWNSIVDNETALKQLVNIDIDANRPVTTGSIDAKWGKNSSDMAYILLQRRLRIAIHAQDMLPMQGTGGSIGGGGVVGGG